MRQSTDHPALPPLPLLLQTNENDDELDDDLEPEDHLIGDIDHADEMTEGEDSIDLCGENFMNDEREREGQETYRGRMIDDMGYFDDLDLASRR